MQKNRLYLFFICFILPFLSIAQKDFKPKETYSVNISTKDTIVKAEVFYGPRLFTPKKELIYYWYTPNKIIATQGGYQGRLLNGEYSVLLSSTNNLKEKGLFINGVKSGEWISWYNNGFIKESFTWKTGKLNGQFKKYDTSGKLIKEGRYSDNLLNGNVNEYSDGKLFQTRKYKKGVDVTVIKKERSKPVKDTTSLKNVKSANPTDTTAAKAAKKKRPLNSHLKKQPQPNATTIPKKQ